MVCPSCGKGLTVILASHDYSINYNEEQDRWEKKIGDVEYVCGTCLEELSTHDIEDILRQVDEL